MIAVEARFDEDEDAIAILGEQLTSPVKSESETPPKRWWQFWKK
jgi:hypothetical protein